MERESRRRGDTAKIPGRKKKNGKPGNDARCCNLCNEEPGKPSGEPRYVESRCLHCRVSWSVTADSYAVDIVIMERVRVPLCLSRYRKRDCPSLLAPTRLACNFPRKSSRFFFRNLKQNCTFATNVSFACERLKFVKWLPFNFVNPQSFELL